MERVGDGLQGVFDVCVFCVRAVVLGFSRDFFPMSFFPSGFSLGDVGLILLNFVCWLAPALCVCTCVW